MPLLQPVEVTTLLTDPRLFNELATDGFPRGVGVYELRPAFEGGEILLRHLRHQMLQHKLLNTV